jgi:haloacetate dehalogenase
MSELFPGFRRETFEVNGVHIHAAVGPRRSGPALLLLHGYPQSHAIWHKAAPRLSARFNVVAADLRGYGDSSKDSKDHTKREMARDQALLMKALGFTRLTSRPRSRCTNRRAKPSRALIGIGSS